MHPTAARLGLAPAGTPHDVFEVDIEELIAAIPHAEVTAVS